VQIVSYVMNCLAGLAVNGRLVSVPRGVTSDG